MLKSMPRNIHPPSESISTATLGVESCLRPVDCKGCAVGVPEKNEACLTKVLIRNEATVLFEQSCDNFASLEAVAKKINLSHPLPSFRSGVRAKSLLIAILYHSGVLDWE